MEEISSDLIKETYAQFGLCVYQIQCIEHSLSIWITHSIIVNRKISRTQMEYELNTILDMTFGQLLDYMKKMNIHLSNDLEDKLEKILQKRNWIIHDFWWENVAKTVNNDGFGEMINELKDLIQSFNNIDDLIMIENSKMAKSMGVDDKNIDEIFFKIVSGKNKLSKKQRTLSKKEQIINMYIYIIDINSSNGFPVFRLRDNDLYTIGDNGIIPLHYIDERKLSDIDKMKKYLPAYVNPKPSIGKYWNYFLDLDTKVRIKVFSVNDQNDDSHKWKIIYPK